MYLVIKLVLLVISFVLIKSIQFLFKLICKKKQELLYFFYSKYDSCLILDI